MRVFKKIICISWSLVLLNSLQAQKSDTTKTLEESTKPPRHSIGLKLGYDQSYLKDINFSPLNYIGNGAVVDLNFKRTTKNENLFFTQLDLTSTTLTPNAPAPPSVNLEVDRTLINFEMGFAVKIKMKNEKLKLHVGGSYHTYLDLLFYKGVESLSFFTTHGLDLSSQITYQIHPRHKLEGALSIPVLAVLVRPPYTGWNKFIDESSVSSILLSGKWTSLNDFGGANFRINYLFDLTRKWSLEAQYRLRFYKTTHLKLAKIATSQTSLGVNFKF